MVGGQRPPLPQGEGICANSITTRNTCIKTRIQLRKNDGKPGNARRDGWEKVFEMVSFILTCATGTHTRMHTITQCMLKGLTWEISFTGERACLIKTFGPIIVKFRSAWRILSLNYE